MDAIPVEPFPPGEYIREAMEARDWTQDDLAEVLGRNRHTVLRVLNGKSAVTAEMAHALAKAFDTSPELWMNLQTAYELSLATQEDRDVERRATIYSRTPVRDLKKRGWIPEVEDTADLERSICEFLGISSIQEPASVLVAARKGTDYSVTTPAQEAWFCQAKVMAASAPASRYAKGNLEAGLSELRKLAAYSEEARRVPRVLGDLGIRFVVVEPLTHSHIDGAAFWLDQSSPAVAMSLRYDRIDNFWFTLMHELSHLRHGHASPIDVDAPGSQQDEDIPEIEKIANREACHALIGQKLDSFIARKRRIISRDEILRFANLHKVHPGIVVGLLHGRKALDWKYHRGLLAKVRAEVVASALTDGWGKTFTRRR